MFKKLFTSNSKLLRDLRNDNYNNWERHCANHNADAAKLQSVGLEVYEHHLKEVIGDYLITGEEKEVLKRIKDYFQLSDAAVNGVKSKYAKNAVTNLSKQKLDDKQLTEEEIAEIELFAKELNISEEEVLRINRKNATELYETAVKDAVTDQYVSVHEHDTLKRLAQQLGINKDVIDKRLRDEYYYLALLSALEQGYLPKCKPPSVTIQEDEIAHWEISSNLILTRNAIIHDGPARLKVSKGVSYALGSCQNNFIREHTGVNQQGVFVITSKRVIFAASTQSFSIPFTQLNSFDTYKDGIGLQENKTELLLQFYDRQMSEVVFKVMTNAINGCM